LKFLTKFGIPIFSFLMRATYYIRWRFEIGTTN
jgi:hypothetical protein